MNFLGKVHDDYTNPGDGWTNYIFFVRLTESVECFFICLWNDLVENNFLIAIGYEPVQDE